MAALMKQRIVYVFTHDSIGLVRMAPHTSRLSSWRACALRRAWKSGDLVTPLRSLSPGKRLYLRGPTALALSRQGLANQMRDEQQVADIARGGYILRQETSDLELILIATGSEVELVMAAAEALGTGVRVVSMPSTSRFDQQNSDYRNAVLPPNCTRRLAVEAGIRMVGINMWVSMALL